MSAWSDVEDQDAYAVDLAEAAAWAAEHQNPVQTALGRLQAVEGALTSLQTTIKELHQPVETDRSGTICKHCSWQLPNGSYFGLIVSWPCPTVELVGG